jgi:hypothetical protein
MRLHSVGKSGSVHRSGVSQHNAEERKKPAHRVCWRPTTALALACSGVAKFQLSTTSVLRFADAGMRRGLAG